MNTKAKAAPNTYQIAKLSGYSLLRSEAYPRETGELGNDYIYGYRLLRPDGKLSAEDYYFVNHVCYYLGYLDKGGRAKSFQMEMFLEMSHGTISSEGLLIQLVGIPTSSQEAVYPLHQ